jgi:Na+/H+-dicarboxylate symporter
MFKKNKLTVFIIVSMLLGVILGYMVHKFGKGNTILLNPSKGYIGKDSLRIATNKDTVVQYIEWVKDSATYNKIKDSLPIATIAFVQKDKEVKFVPNAYDASTVKLEAIDKAPAKASAHISNIKSFADLIKLLGAIFIRLIKMIIAPLIFSTLVVGIAKLGDLKTVGRVGAKAMIWFISASLLSLLLGLVLVNILKPGTTIVGLSGDVNAAKDLMGKTAEFSVQKFVEHVIPQSVIEAMATNEILQIVIFSIFFGVGAASLGDYAKPLIKALDVVSHVVLKLVNYIMNFAPLGIFGALAAVVAEKGLSIFNFYLSYFSSFVLGIAILWLLLSGVGFLILKGRMKELFTRISNPLLIAFSTTSSEAVLPKLTEELERFGCNNKIVSFILPLGYSFNLDGSMMYMTFASIAIAQANGMHLPTHPHYLDIGTQLTMLLVLMLTSKGVAGVPRASLIVVLATCSMFNIPPEGIAIILPIDHFCDMLRSATNVLGNALATSAVSKWEGQLDND